MLSQERSRLLLSWRHSGFSVHTSVTVPPDDRDGLERLARYLLRPPVSLDRLRVGEDAGTLAYAGRRGSIGSGTGDEIARDPLDFLARVVMHIPAPRRHVIRYYGAYSSVVRARRARQAAATADGGAAPARSPPGADPHLTPAHAHRRVTANHSCGARREARARRSPAHHPRHPGLRRARACPTASARAQMASHRHDPRSDPRNPHLTDTLTPPPSTPTMLPSSPVWLRSSLFSVKACINAPLRSDRQQPWCRHLHPDGGKQRPLLGAHARQPLQFLP